MASYSFWNNKGGVGKSFLCFIAASEYAHRHPDTDVYVIDLCPQANVSETLLGGYKNSSKVIEQLTANKPRATVAGYIEARLNSPFRIVEDIGPFVTRPYDYNRNIPKNLMLVCGDNLLELISEAIRQTSQLSIPVDAWRQVLSWIKDLTLALRNRSGTRDAFFILDCNPSFAIYTQLALVASDSVVVPFTADDSSRRAIENVVALLHGIGDPSTAAYSKISFGQRSNQEGLNIPKLHTFVNNRVTQYRGSASNAFRAVSKTIKATMAQIHDKHRNIFANPSEDPSESFIEVPDYHSACIVAANTGTPLHKLTAGPKYIVGERIQINRIPLEGYSRALENLVDRL